MKVGVVVPCFRQERFLPRTIAAVERALAGRDWRGVLVLSAPDADAPPAALPEHWQVLRPRAARALTPGAARNLGFAACGGAWVLFLDADVEVDAAWVERALGVVEADSALGGAWGRLEEWFVDGAAERPGNPDLFGVGDADGESAFLTTPALYRREALERVGGYEARLNSEEDFELGLRLARDGWRLRSLAPRAGRHWSAPRPSFAEIGRRWRAGLCFGGGQVLRLYLGRPGLGAHLRRQAHYFATLALWLSAVPAAAWLGGPGLRLWALAPLGVFAVMWARTRSPRLALHSMLTWTVIAIGMVVGFVRGGARVPPLAGSESSC